MVAANQLGVKWRMISPGSLLGTAENKFMRIFIQTKILSCSLYLDQSVIQCYFLIEEISTDNFLKR